MHSLLQAIAYVLQGLTGQQAEADQPAEEYLAQAVDMADSETRQRALERAP